MNPVYMRGSNKGGLRLLLNLIARRVLRTSLAVRVSEQNEKIIALALAGSKMKRNYLLESTRGSANQSESRRRRDRELVRRKRIVAVSLAGIVVVAKRISILRDGGPLAPWPCPICAARGREVALKPQPGRGRGSSRVLLIPRK